MSNIEKKWLRRLEIGETRTRTKWERPEGMAFNANRVYKLWNQVAKKRKFWSQVVQDV